MQFFTAQVVTHEESQKSGINAAKVQIALDQSIKISLYLTNAPQVFGVSEEMYTKYPLSDLKNLEDWYAHDTINWEFSIVNF